MMLLTKALKTKLIENSTSDNRDETIVVKFFDPCGAGTWLITHIEDDGDTMWGLCDLGMDCVEYGTVSLSELSSVRNRMGLGIERDRHFRGGKVSDYNDRNSLVGV